MSREGNGDGVAASGVPASYRRPICGYMDRRAHDHGLLHFFVGGQTGFAVPLQVALEIVVIVAAVAYFDTARWHELLILANLGVGKGTIVLLVAAPVALLEAVMMVVF